MERTVELTAGVSVSGAVSRNSNPRDGSDVDSRIDDVLLSLLPVRNLRELLVRLVKAWQNVSGSEAVLLGVICGSLRRKFVCHCRGRELPEIDETEFETLPANALFPTFASGHALVAKVGPPESALAFPISGDATAGVLLFGRQENVPSWAVAYEPLVAWSGRLIDQAILIENRSADAQVLDSRKMASLAEFAAGAGHEINNPLATIAGRVQILLRGESDPSRRQNLATIGAQALRVRDMIGDLMLFARPPVAVPARLLLNDAARAIVERFQGQSKDQSCQLSLRETGEVWATADSTQLNLVLSELIRNSLNAIVIAAEAGEIRVGLARSTLAGKCYAVISVADNGVGLSEKDRAHLFDPFYSGRDAGRGLGFGLSKCWRIVTNHGGWIEFESVPRVATTFRVFWPVDPPGSDPGGG